MQFVESPWSIHPAETSANETLVATGERLYFGNLPVGETMFWGEERWCFFPVGDDTTTWKKQPAALRCSIDFPGFMGCMYKWYKCNNARSKAFDSLELSTESCFFLQYGHDFFCGRPEIIYVYIHILIAILTNFSEENITGQFPQSKLEFIDSHPMAM